MTILRIAAIPFFVLLLVYGHTGGRDRVCSCESQTRS
jgi:hypothetical protein